MNSKHYMQRLARATRRLTRVAEARAALVLLLLLVTTVTAWAETRLYITYAPDPAIPNPSSGYFYGMADYPMCQEVQVQEWIPIQKGYTFNHWWAYWTSQDGQFRMANFQPLDVISTAITCDVNYDYPHMIMQAMFDAHHYTLRFHANGGTGSQMADVAMTYDQDVSLPTCTFTKEGYTLIGWNTEADGSGDFYLDQETARNFTAEDNGIVDLYAQYNPGNGTAERPWLIDNSDTWNMFAERVNRGADNNKYYKLTADIEPVSDSRGDHHMHMMGTKERTFSGHFDGDGHQLFFGLNCRGYDANGRRISLDGTYAPFRYVKNATFVNLFMRGHITLEAYEPPRVSVGGIVGCLVSGGNVHFVACRCEFTGGLYWTYTTDVGGAGTMGGFIGVQAENSNATFLDCLGKAGGGPHPELISGYIGAAEGGKATFTNCLETHTIRQQYFLPGFTGEYYVWQFPFVYDSRGIYSNLTFNNCWRLRTDEACDGDPQGSYTSTNKGEAFRATMGDGWTLDENSYAVPKMPASGKAITVNSSAHGYITCPETAAPGEQIIVAEHPEDGYHLTSVIYNDGTNHAATASNGTFYFTMPNADVTITATFSLESNAVQYVSYNTTEQAYETKYFKGNTVTSIGSGTTTWGTAGQVKRYKVSGNVTVNSRITVNGNVHLVLADGATLTAAKGITVHSGNSLTIYGQSKGSGKLIATGSEIPGSSGKESAAIGGEGPGSNYGSNVAGTITIHGGNVNATGWAWTAAIGGGVNSSGGTVIFYGGTTHAATAAENSGDAEAIGRGSGQGVGSGTRVFGNGMRVRLGSNSTPVNANQRANSLSNQKDVTVEPCNSHEDYYGKCRYCDACLYHQITYESNHNTGGTVPDVATINVTTGTGFATGIISENTGGLESTGYTFKCWNTEADGSGTNYLPGAQITIGNSITLYAQWSIVNYSITCNLDGGTMDTPYPETFTVESNDIRIARPTREGYIFKGWTGTGLSSPTKYITIGHGSTNSRTYTATWEEIPSAFPGMFIDTDYEPDEAGYFFVRMPGGEVTEYDYEIDDDVVVFDDEDSPKTVNIPEGFNHSFKVYDSGGKNESYYTCPGGDNDEDGGILTLNCPDGYVFIVNGTMNTEEYFDFVSIFDGNSINSDDALIYHAYGSRTIVTESTGNSITFLLNSDGVDSYDGLDLTVSVIPLPVDITLADDDSQLEASAKNLSVIAANDGAVANVTFDGRTLYRDGTWNTLCLPFDIDDISKTPLKGAAVKTLSTTSYSDGTLTMSFSDNLTALEAGKPCIVKWTPKAFFSITDPDDNVVTSLNFISEVPEVDEGQETGWGWDGGENYDKLVDGRTSTKYGLEGDAPYVEFHYSSAITPKGYALWTANDEEGARNPSSWTIKAKNEGDADWTTLTTVDNSDGEKLPMANNTCTVFPLDNNTAYQYFRFEASLASNNQFQLAELQFCTIQPNASMINIVNPTFRKVAIENSTNGITTAHADFTGTFSSLESTEGRLLDAHNTDGDALHASLSITEPTAPTGYTFGGWYKDELRNDRADFIPFAADGNVTLYAKQTPNAYTVAFNKNANDATGTMVMQAFIYGTAQTFTANAFTRDGYTFSGWNTEADGSGTAYTDEESVSNLTAEQNGTAVLYAQWTPDVISITMNGAGIMTYSSEWPLDFSNMTKEDGTELTAYIVSGYNPDAHSIVLTPVTDIPASTGLLLKGTANADFTVPVQSTAMVYANLLVAVTSAETIVPLTDGTKTNYILANGSYGIDWYTLSEAGSIGANKAYLQLPASASQVRALTWIFEDETTGIKTAESSERRTDAWYTLDGKKLSGKPEAKGLYIHNGKKTVIK